MGLRFARTRDLNEQLAWLLNRRAFSSRNLYAMAQGKRTALKLGSAHMAEIGRKGAQVRWDRERARKAAELAQNAAQPAISE